MYYLLVICILSWHTHTQFRSCNYWIAGDGRTLQTYLAGLLTMPRAMADAGLISGLALMGLATQHPPVSCQKCQSCYNACGEGQHPLVSNLRSSVELGLAIVRYSGLSKSLYHASGEALEGWLSRILALLELSWPAPPHPLLETGKARVDINRQALWFLKARFQYLSILFLLDEVLWMSLVPSKLGCRPVDRLPSCVAGLKMWPEARGWNWFMVHCFAVLQNDTWTRNPTVSTDCVMFRSFNCFAAEVIQFWALKSAHILNWAGNRAAWTGFVEDQSSVNGGWFKVFFT